MSIALRLCLGTLGLLPAPHSGGARATPDEFHTLRVGVVVYEGVEILDFAGPVEVFSSAGGRLRVHGQPLFEVVTVGPTNESVFASGGVEMRPSCSIAERPQLDIVVIPGGETGSLDGDDFRAWLRETSAHATVVMSVCNGAFVLAELGLLDGCEATTFHSFLGFLKESAPKTKVLSGRRVVDNGRIVTAGGVACGIDGALHLVARFGGRRLADSVAEYMEYRWTPEPQLEGAYSEWATVGGDRAVLEQQLRWLRGRRDWPAAEKIARELTDLDLDDGWAWYELGYALLSQGRVEEAIEASEESARLPGRRPNALYNVSCAWAKKGEKDQAFDALSRAAEAGWDDRSWGEQDQDLASLRGDPRFVALLDRIGAQGTRGRPEWVAARIVRASEAEAAGDFDDVLQVLVNGLNGAPDDERARGALESALARAAAANAASKQSVRNAQRALAAHPRPVPPAPSPPPAPPPPPSRPRARRVAIVLFDDASLVELIAPAHILDSVPGFTTYTVAATRAPVAADEATILPDYTYDDAPAPDVILVSSGGGSLRDTALRDWLRRNGPRADAVMSICNGALVLANAGLLDGKAVTCPRGNFDGLRLFAKDVRPFRDRRFSRDGNVVTSDSYFAGVDGALEVVRFLCGDADARSSATRNLYDWRPREPDPGQLPTPPSYQLAILRTVLDQGVDAGLAEYRKWLESGPREQGGPVAPARECLRFQILGWTLSRSGRTDEGLRLCEFITAAFPESAYAHACLGEAYYECGRFDDALATLLEADRMEPGEEKAQEIFAAILRHPDHVANEDSGRARQLLREHASDSSATLTPAGEPGERMVIRGVVRDAGGRPIPGARMHVFHDDARLFAFLRSDDEGRYAFTTVRPGGNLQHVNCEVEALGHATRRFQLLFRDDPRLAPHAQPSAAEREHAVIELVRDGAGTLRGSCDVTLR